MVKEIVLWDWNGTLLDDVSICIDSMNHMLQKRGMDKIDSVFYKSTFNFPVFEYYTKLGFNFKKESFEDLSVEFMAEYNSRINSSRLQDSAFEVLTQLREQGRKQIIISAMEQSMLNNLLTQHNIIHFFNDVVGLTDIYANGKIELAREFIKNSSIDTSQTTFIGDTLHDAEVAEEIGSDILLVANGHHNIERLTLKGCKIIRSLSDILMSLN